jgi:hypothetical protein
VRAGVVFDLAGVDHMKGRMDNKAEAYGMYLLEFMLEYQQLNMWDEVMLARLTGLTREELDLAMKWVHEQGLLHFNTRGRKH